MYPWKLKSNDSTVSQLISGYSILFFWKFFYKSINVDHFMSLLWPLWFIWISVSACSYNNFKGPFSSSYEIFKQKDRIVSCDWVFSSSTSLNYFTIISPWKEENHNAIHISKLSAFLRKKKQVKKFVSWSWVKYNKCFWSA